FLPPLGQTTYTVTPVSTSFLRPNPLKLKDVDQNAQQTGRSCGCRSSNHMITRTGVRGEGPWRKLDAPIPSTASLLSGDGAGPRARRLGGRVGAGRSRLGRPPGPPQVCDCVRCDRTPGPRGTPLSTGAGERSGAPRGGGGPDRADPGPGV